jgi:antitoxin component HigA of HigAB toxin-antitoxin module
MKPKTLQTKAEHAAALSHVEALMDAAPGSSEEAELELWTLLIENYESKHHPAPSHDPIEKRQQDLGKKWFDFSTFETDALEMLQKRRGQQ